MWHIQIRVRINDITYVAFLIPNEWKEEEKLVVFHLYIPMGYVESASLFCAATATFKDMVNNNTTFRYESTEHPLEKFVETPPDEDTGGADQNILQGDKYCSTIPARARQVAPAYVEVYLYNFIGVVQGGPDEKIYLTGHLFHSINALFRPNNPLDVAR